MLLCEQLLDFLSVIEIFSVNSLSLNNMLTYSEFQESSIASNHLELQHERDKLIFDRYSYSNLIVLFRMKIYFLSAKKHKTHFETLWNMVLYIGGKSPHIIHQTALFKCVLFPLEDIQRTLYFS